MKSKEQYSTRWALLKRILVLVPVLLLQFAFPVRAAEDYFLKIEGIAGASNDARHKDEIDLLGWSWGETQPPIVGGRPGGIGKVSMQDFHVVMRLSKASPKLMQACASGEHLKSAVLTGRKAGTGQQEYLEISLSDIFISSYQTEVAGGDGGAPTDHVAISFAKIEIEYKEYKADGTLGATIKSGWDLKQNKRL